MAYVLESRCLFMFVGILLQRKVNTCKKKTWMMILQLMKRKSQNPIDVKNDIDDS